jgi:hypothetical protein
LDSNVRTVLVNEVPITELSASDDSEERRLLPRNNNRSGEGINLWNFGAEISDAENLLLEQLDVSVSGTVDDSQYLGVVDLYYDMNNDGGFEVDNPTGDPIIASVTVNSDNQTLSFTPAPPGFFLEAGKTHQFYLLADLANGSTSLYGQTVQFSFNGATDFQLRGELSGALATPLPAPFISDVKTIVQPSVTVATGSALDPIVTPQVTTCINNSGADIVQFEISNGDSEQVIWDNVVVTGDSSSGTGGLSQYVDGVWMYLDRNSDAEFNNLDVPLGFDITLYKFTGNTATLNLANDLGCDPTDPGCFLFFFSELVREQLNPARNETETFTLAYSLSSPTAVSTNGSVFFDGSLAASGINMVGHDSGDPVLVNPDGERAGTRQVMSQGDVRLFNSSQGIDDFEDDIIPLCPTLGNSPPDTCSEMVEALAISTSTSPIEWIYTDTLVIDVIKSNPALDLNQVISGARLTHRKGLGFAVISELTVDAANNQIRLDTPIPDQIDLAFYSFWPNPTPNAFSIFVDVLPTAPIGESITLQISNSNNIDFRGGCSLIGSPSFDTIVPDGFPIVGRPLNFEEENTILTISLDEPLEDVSPVAFPDQSIQHPVVLFRLSANIDVTEQILHGITFDVSGSADDIAALAANGVELFQGATTGSSLDIGEFNADNGSVTFGGPMGSGGDLNFTIDANEDFSLRFSPSASTQLGNNDGDTFDIIIEEMDVIATSAISGLPVRKIEVRDEVLGSTVEDPPFRAPQVRIGAGRIFAERELESSFSEFHVKDATNIVVMAFTLEPDRAENLFLEQLVITDRGTLNPLTSLESAAVVLHINESPFNQLELFEDIPIGSGVFNADNGTATINITPALELEKERDRHFFLIVDQNGNANDFDTFQHVLEGQMGISARGELSNDLATPFYGGDQPGRDEDLGELASVEHTIGKATLDLSKTNELPDSGDQNPTFVLPGTENIPMLHFEAEALEVEDMQITSMTFQNIGSANEATTVERARLYRDLNEDGIPQGTDVLIGEGTIGADDGPLTITFDPSINIVEGGEDTWLLTYDIADVVTLGEHVQALLPLDPETTTPVEMIFGGRGLFSDETIGAIRSQVGGDEFDGPYVQFTPGIVDASRGSNNPGSRDIPLVSNGEVLFQFRLQEVFDLEDVQMEQINLNVTSENNLNFQTAFSNTTFRLYREDPDNINGEVDVEDTEITTSVFNPTSGRIEFDLSGETEIISQDTRNTYLVTMDVDAPEVVLEGEFQIGFSDVSLFGGTGQTSTLPAVFRFVSNPFESSEFTLNRPEVRINDDSQTPDDNDEIAPLSPDETLLLFSARASSASDIELQSLTIQATGSIDETTAFAANSIRLVADVGTVIDRLDNDDIVFQSQSFPADNGTITFTGFGAPLVFGANQTIPMMIVGSLNGTATEGQTMGLLIPDIPDSVVFVTSPGGGPVLVTDNSDIPMDAGPTPLVPRSITISDANPALQGIEILPDAQDQALALFQLLNNRAEELTLNSVTVSFSGTVNESTAFTNGTVQVHLDRNNNEVFDPSSDDLLGTGIVSSDNGSVVVSGLDVDFNKNFSRRFFVVANMSGTGSIGQTIQASITDVNATGQFSTIAADVVGVPYQAPLFTLANPSATFVQPGAETITSFIPTSPALNAVIQTAQVNVGTADDVILQSIEFELQTGPTRGSLGFASTTALDPNSLSLVLDVDKDGNVTDDDIVLASGQEFSGNRAIFNGLSQTLARGERHFLLFTGTINEIEPRTELGARVLSTGVSFIEAGSTNPLIPTGLPQVGSTRLIELGSTFVGVPFREDFDGERSLFRPASAWRYVNDPDNARVGTGYFSANDSNGLLLGEDYPLYQTTHANLTLGEGQEEFQAWVRYNFPDTGYRASIQTSLNDGEDWSVIGTITGSSPAWELESRTLSSSTVSAAEDVLFRVVLDAGSNPPDPDAYFHIDRVTVQSRNPRIDIRNFTLGSGSGTIITPGQQNIAVSFDVRNLSTNEIEILNTGIRFQGPEGQNLSQFFTLQPQSSPTVLTGSGTNTYTYLLSITSEPPVSEVQLDPFVEYADSTTLLPQVEDSDNLNNPFTIIIVDLPNAMMAQ